MTDETQTAQPLAITKPSPKLRLRAFTFPLLMGFLTTIALSWNLALWRPVPRRMTFCWTNGASNQQPVTESDRTVYEQTNEFGSLRRMSSPDPKGNWFFAPRPVQTWSILEQKPVNPNQLIIEDIHGWPRLALRATFTGKTIKPGQGWKDSSWKDQHLHTGIRIRPHLSNSYRFTPFDASLAVPLEPIYRNFIIDILFWSLIWLIIPHLLFIYPEYKYLRRRYRVRHNHCVICAYDLRGHSHKQCPECGTDIMTAKQTGTPIPKWGKPTLLIITLIATIIPIITIAVQWQSPWTIHEAVALHDPEAIRTAVLAGSDINEPSDPRPQFAQTPIEEALINGDTESLKALLDLGASDFFNDRSPLPAACASGKPELLELMLAYGADPNSSSVTKKSPFAICIFGGASPEMVQMMLDYGADLNLPPDQYYMLPLIAAMYGRKEDDAVIDLLIQAGADINQTDSDGFTPLMSAAINKRSQTIIHLIELGADINAKDQYNRTALEIAITAMCNLKAIRTLIEHGATITPFTFDGQHILSYALWNDDPKVFEYILAQPTIDINQQDAVGQTVLMRNVQNEWIPEQIKILLASGADPNAGDQTTWDILNLCATPEIRKIIQSALNQN